MNTNRNAIARVLATIMVTALIGFSFAGSARADAGAASPGSPIPTACEINPNSVPCLKDQADEACAQFGDGSMECLTAQNAYLKALDMSQASSVETLTEQNAYLKRLSTSQANSLSSALSMLALKIDLLQAAERRVDRLELRVERQKDTIESLRHRLHHGS